MTIKKENGEKHILITVNNEALTHNSIQEIQKEVLNIWENSSENIVIDFHHLSIDEPSGMGFLKDLSEQALENGCSFVLAGGNSLLQTFADENQISYAPTREEAVDTVFIESIEREFNNGEEDF